MTNVHIINHTHWDREWFLTHEYTTTWVPPLIDSLETLATNNPDYEYLLDGQTLAIEDLLTRDPSYRDRVNALISNGQLEIGPCYSQPDWRMISGELQLRNLMLGLDDAESFGGSPDVAWLVDTFGHISQAPQMLTLAGINAAFVWRGVPQMVPLFHWRGSDGTELAAINLFGGYRNLYGITKTPDIAVDRLLAETEKLAGSYGLLPVPLFDGYDLDSEPEDPATYYADLDVPDTVTVHASSPRSYADAAMAHLDAAPTIDGELISGKYGSTFPGSLSSRTYLKVMHHDAENALHRRVEPLSVMAQLIAEQTAGAGSSPSEPNGHAEFHSDLEAASRTLLQNGVHDCLCGVSIDQVHERMERSYRQTLAWADKQQQELASIVLSAFAPGVYGISTHAMPTKSVVRAGSSAVEVTTAGVGVSAATTIAEVQAINEPTERFEWSNEHFDAVVDSTAISVSGAGRLARLIVRRDNGDTYSSEPAEVLGELALVDGPIVLDKSAIDTTVRTNWKLNDQSATDLGIEVEATVDARFDQGPVIDFTIRLDSNGTGFRVDAEFDTSIETDSVYASMPFDVVERGHDDHDLFGTDIDPALASILMGQRETGRVTEFPFHDFVALSTPDTTRAVMAKGIRSYQSNSTGQISVTLRRSAEWLALTGLTLRSGDAGPAMYVPGARSERWIEHRIGFVALGGPIDTCGLYATNEAFHNPPVIGSVSGTDASCPSEWTAFAANLPLTAFATEYGQPVARLFNPSSTTHSLDGELSLRSLRGDDSGSCTEVAAKQIITAAVSAADVPRAKPGAEIKVISNVHDRVGLSRSKPQPAELAKLAERIDQLAAQLAETEGQLAAATGNDVYRTTHQTYVLDRERLELALSLELNERLAASDQEVSIPDDPDPVIAELGAQLNDLRIKRRIYDYVVAALP